MKPLNLVAHSLRTLVRYKLRTGFMMVGSLLGVAALTFVLLVGQGARRKMLATVKQNFGAASLLVMAGPEQTLGGPRPESARLTIDDLETVAKAVPAVEAWDPVQTLAASVRHGGIATTARVLGQSERSARVWGRGVSRGTYFDSGAVQRLERVALLGHTVARALFGEADPLHQEIQIGTVSFTVVGLLEPFGTDLHGMDRDNEIVVPISTLMRRLDNVDTIALARIQLHSAEQVEESGREIGRRLRAAHGLALNQPDDFRIITPVEIQQMTGRVQRILAWYLPAAATLVLLVGGIVAATLMLSSASARVAEIGLRRAVGARAEHIGWQFLVETTLTVFGGGVVGSGLGLAAGSILAAHLKLEVHSSWTAVLPGLFLAVVTGFLAGILPARRAARLLPVEALR